MSEDRNKSYEATVKHEQSHSKKRLRVEDNDETELFNPRNDEERTTAQRFVNTANKKAKNDKVRVIPIWMQRSKSLGDEKVSLDDFVKKCSLHSQIVANIRNQGIAYLFPVQSVVIPHILESYNIGGDICVCAPTGSGKTLTYAIPIVQTLLSCAVKRLRALVLVPTRDLVLQVTDVFQKMIQGTQLKVAALYGDKSFSREQAILVGNARTNLACGTSLVDIVVSTPGRLIDHIPNTPGFTLQHLRFLVVDEADRLLMQSYQDWLAQVLHAMTTTPTGKVVTKNDGSLFFDACTIHNDTASREGLDFSPQQKLLFSATLTQNPTKLASLKLVNPSFFSGTDQNQNIYKIPTNLEQKLLRCQFDEKPLYLLTILQQYEAQQILCFTSSVESTHRLTLLLKLLMENYPKKVSIAEYSGNLTQKQRATLMRDFKSGKIRLVICSDVMSRGLDIHDVELVINYDVPKYIHTYVHRVGRTARAGRAGLTITIARYEEVKFFKEILKKAENSVQRAFNIDRKTNILPHLPKYKVALHDLEVLLAGEQGAPVRRNKKLEVGHIEIDTQTKNDVDVVLRTLKSQAQSCFFPDTPNKENDDEKMQEVELDTN